MKKDTLRSNAILIIKITLAGLVLMGLAYGLYVLFHFIIQRSVFAAAAIIIPTVYTRLVFALIMVLSYWFVSRSKMKDLIKAIAATVPTGSLILAAGIGLYQWPAAAWAAKLLVLALIVLYLYKSKKQWIYFYAVALAALLALIY
ncbi:MAG: hypothetical protein ACYC5K_08130 [Saccharofermentanales bacterium]